jgi:hypothetical protein
MRDQAGDNAMKKTIFTLGSPAFVAVFFVRGCVNTDDQPTLSLSAQSGTIA